MTAASSVVYPSMELLHPEDTMDLASSPRIPSDDLDLPYELDTMRDASAEPTREEMVEDPINLDQHYTEDVRFIDEDLLDDEDMVDEDTVVQNADANHEDFTMESQQQALTHAEHEDDDILYDDDEFVREDNDEAHYAHDVEIVDEEDLFHEDEVQVYAPEDTSHALKQLHSNQDEKILGEQQTTNIITQDAEDSGAVQGPQLSGDSANKTSDNNVYNPTEQGYGTKYKLDNETTSDTDLAAELMIKEPAKAPTDSADKPQSEYSTELAKVDSVGPSVPAAMQDSSHVKASELPAHENDFDRRADAELRVHGTEPEDEHFTCHQARNAPLHTVKVNYQDTDICLFPPIEDDDSETFFLADVDLAHQSLDKLLGACHDVLAGTIGDDDELVLDIPSLGLHISQDSSYATQMTLSQILDVYLSLSQNEQTKEAEPLYCHLSSRVSLASQHAYLLSAAEKGKTFTEIAAEHLHSHRDSPEEGEEDHELDESQEGYYDELGQNERVQIRGLGHNEDLDHKDADRENLDHETLQQQRDSHTDGLPFPDDVFANKDAPDSSLLESVLETGGDGFTGDAENETSATSTVHGDEQELQGEHDPFSDIYYDHDLYYCLDCDANLFADFETSYDGLAAPADLALAPRNDPEDTEGVVVHNKSAEDEDGNAETQSAIGDTESSRTIEAGDDTLESSLNADAEAEKHHVDNHPNTNDTVDAEKPADTVHALSDTQKSTEVNTESFQGDGLHNYYQDFRPILQPVQEPADDMTTVGVDAEFDHDDLLDVHDENEGHESAETDGHEDLFELHQSNGVANKAESGNGALQEEDDFLLGDDDANAPFQESTPPVTPSGSKTSKRKSRDEEDEFDLLDSGTPDVKRRRPS